MKLISLCYPRRQFIAASASTHNNYVVPVNHIACSFAYKANCHIASTGASCGRSARDKDGTALVIEALVRARISCNARAVCYVPQAESCRACGFVVCPYVKRVARVAGGGVALGISVSTSVCYLKRLSPVYEITAGYLCSCGVGYGPVSRSGGFHISIRAQRYGGFIAKAQLSKSVVYNVIPLIGVESRKNFICGTVCSPGGPGFAHSKSSGSFVVASSSYHSPSTVIAARGNENI